MREATQTVGLGLHGQPRAVEKIKISQRVRAVEDRSRCKEIVSQVSDAGQQSNMICRNEEDTAHTLILSPTTSLFGSPFLSHDKQPTIPTHVVVKNVFCSVGAPSVGGPRHVPHRPHG